MPELPAIPAAFPSEQDGDWVPIAVRPGLERDEAAKIVAAIDGVAWEGLWHAYGPASDVAAQLVAVTVGDAATRRAAWRELWGNIYHQTTTYEATVPAVPILARLTVWRGYPDRVEAIVFLREVAATTGLAVWRYDDDGEIAHDERRAARLTRELRAVVDRAATALLDGWRGEPRDIRRALLWLLSALPEHERRYAGLVEAELPERFRRAWALLRRGPDSQEEYDEVVELEDWATGAS